MATQTVGEFILGLLDDEEAADAYRADPAGALAAAGIGALSPADLADLAPAVAESPLLGVRGHWLVGMLAAAPAVAAGDDARAIETFSP
ncbi:IniB N-terminal domain-containing protein [Skermania piniformis]|uniref:IniB N-terminal domain-containing protein n=1 Tax=Skermania pinensis TaxID=39122 RepID=A0ABX8S9L8_9ACTN|nr:IniB N-terminal domain-containing protein [Skermania piniformis]QXQ13682.1 IniB N-terminal domain-containing protein [Skermania piniformis]